MKCVILVWHSFILFNTLTHNLINLCMQQISINFLEHEIENDSSKTKDNYKKHRVKLPEMSFVICVNSCLFIKFLVINPFIFDL